MDTIKRPSESFYNDTKKLRKTFNTEENRLTIFEHLSNELFYEIFEYLDGYDIYKAFSNLNFRFEHLITYSLLPLKIKLRSEAVSELKNCCKNLIIPYRHRIFSLEWENQSLIDDFFTHCILNSSFDHLQSIVISEISIDKSVVFVFYLKSLPHLSSLTMTIYGEGSSNLRDIYRMIFSFPSLKYNKLSAFWLVDDDDMDVFMPLAVNEQLSTIEYLVINHRCTVNELFSMLSHTPRLRRLICNSLLELVYPLRIEQSIVLSNLTYIRFDAFLGDFDDFELSMAKLLAPVEIFIINNVFDETYLDADRWERFIMKHMLHLRQLKFTFGGDYAFDHEDTPSNELINRFASPFWIERQWFFKVKIDHNRISYSIRPYKNVWLDTYKEPEITAYCNGNIDDNSIQLYITKNPPVTSHDSLLDKLKSHFVGVQFTRLIINCENISIELLVNIIHLLPSLVSLKVSSLPLIEPVCLLDDDAEMRFLTSINNKITKVNLEKIMNIEQVHFILYLCLRVQYFQVDIPEDMDLSRLLRFILVKASTYIPYLNTLCLSLSSADNEIFSRLQMIIESEKLSSNYMIKRIGNHILLKQTSH